MGWNLSVSVSISQSILISVIIYIYKSKCLCHAIAKLPSNCKLLLKCHISPTAVCKKLGAIENGVISYSIDNVGPDYDLGTVATYSCDPHFQINTNLGNEKRTCVDSGADTGGIFSGDAPTCDRKCLHYNIIYSVILTYLWYTSTEADIIMTSL